MVEAELNSFITKRHNDRAKTEGARALEDFWKTSERRQEALRRVEEDRTRLEMHRHLDGVYARRSEEHRRCADALCTDGGCSDV